VITSLPKFIIHILDITKGLRKVLNFLNNFLGKVFATKQSIDLLSGILFRVLNIMVSLEWRFWGSRINDYLESECLNFQMKMMYGKSYYTTNTTHIPNLWLIQTNRLTFLERIDESQRKLLSRGTFEVLNGLGICFWDETWIGNKRLVQ
jgi:hypothetical protein